MSIHEAARAGFSNAADAYERGRPSYPAAVVRAVVERLGIGPGATVLDLGAGTGELTRLLTPFGAGLLALEPVRAMRDKLTELVPEARARAPRRRSRSRTTRSRWGESMAGSPTY
jgi:2-polyprenyl-3-methyl-5-hydroxy-6-metoxy-1,4-benzoquinol methylase